MKIVAITGRMAMGKSTVAQLLFDAGFPVFSCDDYVRETYRSDGDFQQFCERLFAVPYARLSDKEYLRERILAAPQLLDKLEDYLHTKLFDACCQWLRWQLYHQTRMVFLEIPLLYGTNFQKLCDDIIVVSAPSWIQKDRIAQRRGIEKKFVRFLLGRQMNDTRQRQRASYVVYSGVSLYKMRRQVYVIVRELLL